MNEDIFSGWQKFSETYVPEQCS